MLKQIEVTIENGRDAGKTFKIKELPATQMDKWLTRLFGCLADKELTVVDIANMSFEEIINSIYKIEMEEEKERLFDELLASCYLIKEGVDIAMKGNNIDAFVEEWSTLFRLKNEALKLNLGFFENGEESTSS